MERTGEARIAPNIALIKYWGKIENSLKIPLNGSLSMTLDRDKIHSKTKITMRHGGSGKATFLLNGVDEPITKYHNIVLDFFLKGQKDVDFEITSENNFPTAAGMASSASGLACFVLTLCEVFQYFDKEEGEDCFDYINRISEEVSQQADFFQRDPSDKLVGEFKKILQISCLVRAASGSAARSIFKGLVMTVGPSHLFNPHQDTEMNRRIQKLISWMKPDPQQDCEGEDCEYLKKMMGIYFNEYLPQDKGLK